MKILLIVLVSIGIVIFFRFYHRSPQLNTVPTEQLYKETQHQIYDLLFCDDLAKYDGIQDAFPAFFAPNPSPKELLAIAQNPDEEARMRILAYRRLKEIGVEAPTREILGVVVEYNQPGLGLDTLAIYPDGNIRYINYTGKMIFMEPLQDKELNDLRKQIFQQAKQLARAISSWEKPRLPPPGPGQVRITLLVSGDIYFGQAPFNVMSADPLGTQLLQTMTALLVQVTQMSLEAQEQQEKDPKEKAQ